MQQLYDELTTGPLAAEISPFIESGNDVAINEILHRKDIDAYTWVSVAKFESWCAVNKDEYVLIETHASNSSSPLYSAAKAMLRRLLNPVEDNAFNLSDPQIFYLFDNWPFVDQTGITKEALLSVARVKNSRSDQLAELDINISTIAKALRG